VNNAPDCYVCGTQMQRRFDVETNPLFQCKTCRIECLSPQPDDATLAQIYGKSYYDIYGANDSLSETKRMKQRTFSHFIDMIGPRAPGSRLLDCGAGTGFLVDLAKHRGLDAYAVELSDYGAEQCRAIVGADHVFRGELTESTFAANLEDRYDIITMIDVIEHVRDPRATLRWANSHLSPGGTLVIVTPKAGSLSHWLMGKRWAHYKVEHLWYFAPESIRRLLLECGFSVKRMRSTFKYLSLEYIRNISLAYHNPIVGVASRALARVLPRSVRKLPLPLFSGDMFIQASVLQSGLPPPRIG
jgi:2-polyprenyl-3-methyl-5-hydroxy-6-metoxy-1,4-benzoquinol methylase